jgi:hypothetical protein
MPPGRPYRRIGLDHNPLRRTVDRVEAYIVLSIVAVAVFLLPCLTYLAGRTAYTGGVHAERIERAQRHRVQALVLADATTAAGRSAAQDLSLPSRTVTSAGRIFLPARWTTADGTLHTGSILVDVRARAGTRIPVWTDLHGRPADPPQRRGQTMVDTAAAAAVIAVAGAALLTVIRLLTRRILDRRRMAQWEDAWWRFEPRWSGRST